MSGLWAGLIIGYITEYYTSNKYGPVLALVESTRMGAAPNIILGLALGYTSTVIPILCIAITVYICYSFAGMYGVALGALGMLGCLPIALTIDGYGPISDNAGGIAEMSYLTPEVRKRTDKLDAAGNTTAAIGKGFAIGSACLVSLALFGAYITRIN
jgi:inorganic pyrophosphatase